MDTNESEAVDVPEVEEVYDVEETEYTDPTEDVSELKARIQKLEEKRIADRERNKITRQEIAKLKRATAPAPSNPTGELDETQLDYLDLKGVTADEDIQVIESVVKRTGMTVRQALKDEYVQGKLDANKARREVKDATPSSNKRSGSGQANDLSLAIAKFEQSGVLPDDFALRSQVVNAISDRSSRNKPVWH